MEAIICKDIQTSYSYHTSNSNSEGNSESDLISLSGQFSLILSKTVCTYYMKVYFGCGGLELKTLLTKTCG